MQAISECHQPHRNAVCDARAVTKGRLEAFTEAVIAIVMTIMVLDLRPPPGHGFSDLKPLICPFVVAIRLEQCFSLMQPM